jgi:NADH-quinone oxidoreductase subunit L
MHNEQDMRRMGGLRKFMPITAMTFVFGWLAIAGIFPLSGFWSKDEILAKAWFGHDYGLWLIGAAAALLTAFYMTRQVWLVFYSPERFGADAAYLAGEEHAEAGTEVTTDEAPAGVAHADAAVEPPHESPRTMYIPLMILAFCSLVGGVIDLPFVNSELNFLDRWLQVPEGPVAPHFSTALLLSIVALALGVLGIWWGISVYRRGLRADGSDETVVRLGGFAPVLENAWYIDAAVSKFVSGPATKFARFLSDDVDEGAIDGAVNGVADATRAGGSGLRRLQTGLVRNYALGIAFGTVILLLYLSTRVAF